MLAGAFVDKKLWDITPLVTSRFPLWPGSVPLQRMVEMDMRAGDEVTTSSLTATAHLGAHADAPSHYAKEGVAIDARALEFYLGPCQVIRPNVMRGQCIARENAGEAIAAPRVLFATSTFDYGRPFQEDFASFDPAFFEFLAKSGVMTVGIDTPSVDIYAAQDLPCHRLAYQYDMALLENLDLSGVPAGIYELIALPLKIEGFDASPVRAVLRSL